MGPTTLTRSRFDHTCRILLPKSRQSVCRKIPAKRTCYTSIGGGRPYCGHRNEKTGCARRLRSVRNSDRGASAARCSGAARLHVCTPRGFSERAVKTGGRKTSANRVRNGPPGPYRRVFPTLENGPRPRPRMAGKRGCRAPRHRGGPGNRLRISRAWPGKPRGRAHGRPGSPCGCAPPPGSPRRTRRRGRTPATAPATACAAGRSPRTSRPRTTACS